MDTFGLEVGDEVTVARIVKEQDGWDNQWAGGMDKFVGDGAVYLVSGTSDVGVRLTQTYKKFGDSRVHYSWPPASLDKVHDLFDVEET